MDLFSSSNSEFLSLVRSSTARKAQAGKWLQYYHDQQSEQTLNLIRQRWSRPETFRVFQVNAVKKVINKRANLYRLAPRRSFIGIDQAAGDELYRSANVDIVLKRLSRLTKLLKTTVLQVGWMNEQLTLSVVTPAMLDVVYRDIR